MRLELLDSLSLPGDPTKPNEDSFASAAAFAAVFDGATPLGEPLMPGKSDAYWLAQFSARRLAAHAAEDGAAGPRDWLRAAAADAEKSFKALRVRAPKETYEIPFASVMVLAVADDALDAVWLGDCAAFIHQPSGRVSVLGDTLERRAKERARAAKLAGEQGGAAPGIRAQFLPALRASRNRVNWPGNDWLFAPDAASARHAATTRLAAVPGTLVLLASDGFVALVSDYERYTPETLLAATKERGLKSLAEELRAIEAADSVGARYPRFKKSDDATALLLALKES